jgi:hypothetical protein
MISMKLDKAIVQRRIDLMEAEGIVSQVIPHPAHSVTIFIF